MTKFAVFTDLDGTLLNHHDYSYQDALPAIANLRARHIPLILVSSKTRAEMAHLCQELDIQDPYVCENGSVIVLPKPWVQQFNVDTSTLTDAGECWLAFRGAARDEILTIVKANKGECPFVGFADMTVEDVIACTGLSHEAATKAMQRDATEPLLWPQDGAGSEEFARKLGVYNLQLLKGGRFYHVMANCDKGDSVRYLLSLYQSYYGASVHSIALGDSQNDLKMLKAVDTAVVMPHPDGSYMSDKGLIGELHAPYPGAKGWRYAVEQALQQ
ncbi:HAD-IIB family hydrolase [Gilvimarinus agarilyticus]|uniref:HAD-IIB family hydrolase n=1 Tax=Gilvimarinus sp. 2_MG-2023 TaxID=3062666 RepID=UPI001C09D727|nr:HAD-IIB family hydrolase [Gilvimarinus sp. 2_MG-2023]MBU2886032.1 HAD-IIB family hydrolase [Gilvimarinus agarilyticus]MDO6570778.1 HAD-IIB family hydrolase [Gilvimarinus sp. 2_MG-2023]